MRVLSLFVGLVLVPPFLAAQSGPPRLELKNLVREALQRNPEILAEQKRYEASRQKPRQESSLPDPMASLGYNSNGNPLPGAGLGRDPTSNIGVMFSQEFPYPGKLRLRGEVAQKESEAELSQYAIVQLNVISRLKQAYYRLQHDYAEVDVLDRNRELLRQLLRITEARYSVGKAEQQDVFKAQIQLTLLETRTIQLVRDQRVREAEINSLLDRQVTARLGKPADPHIEHFTTPFEELEAQVLRRAPMVMRDQKMIERNEAALKLARKNYYPDYTLNGGYFNQGSMPPMYMLRADVRLPVYFFRKQRAAVTEQVQEVSEAHHTYEATTESVLFRLRDDYAMVEASSKLLQLYREMLIPQAGLAVKSSLASYETGTLDFLSVLSNYLMAIDYEMNYHEEMQNFHLALSRLEEMSGLNLIP